MLIHKRILHTWIYLKDLTVIVLNAEEVDLSLLINLYSLRFLATLKQQKLVLNMTSTYLGL